MRKIALFYLLTLSITWGQQQPFNRGVNLTSWFQVDDIRQIQFSKFDRQDFVQLKSLGVDVVRLPLNLHFMTNGAPDYTIDPLFYFFLDQVVDWAEEQQIHLILDNHTFDVTLDTDPNIDQILIPVWTQMAEHFEDRSNYIYYEILNEPHGIDDARWNEIQQAVVDAIRLVDQTHTIVIGPAGWNSYSNLAAMPIYNNDNLIYTFHFYDPFIFTHQGASWTDPSMEPLANVPFPYDASKMPDCPPELVGTWIQSELNAYSNNGTIQKVRDLLDIAFQFQQERNVQLFCGEFGVFIPNSPNNDRTLWYNIVRTYLEQNNIAWTIWDYKGAFGLFDKGSNEMFDYDLNIPLVNSLGFNEPAQFEYVLNPDSTELKLYDDYIGKNISGYSWTEGEYNFYNDDDPAIGNFSLTWTGANQYDAIVFDFLPDKDLSRLLDEDFVFDFWFKGDNLNIAFDIRFIDTKTDVPEDHPWRMRYTINSTVVDINNEWQHIQIPLKEFSEHGSWDDGWFNPIGDFDWKAVDRFEIVAEHKNLPNQLWFDDIKIYNPNVSFTEESESIPLSFKLEQNYPNPFNPTTVISYQLPVNSQVKLKVYDVLGKEIATLVNAEKNPGMYKVYFDAKNLPSGIYFYQLKSGSLVMTKKMVLMK
ncbi:MAG: cellulase family glycosylhydrolase [bacterium]